MDKLEWLELLEQNNKASIAINSGDIQSIADEVDNLIRLINTKASYAAEYGGWYTEFEQFVDGLPSK